MITTGYPESHIETLLFTRDRGAPEPEPVLVTPGGYLWSDSTYRSRRSLLVTLTGHPEARHWTWDRYFKQGRYLTTVGDCGATQTVLEALGWQWPLTVCPGSAPQAPRGVVKSPLGIDLQKRGHEVAKLLYAGFGYKIHRGGYDPDDVLQEVYKGILIRNQGRCPFDPEKSSFGHYVHMVCSCVLSNYHRKQERTPARQSETLEDNPELTTSIPSGSDDLVADDFSQFLATPGRGWHPDLAPLAVRVLPLVKEGRGRSEISQVLELPHDRQNQGLLSQVLSYLKIQAQRWATSSV